MDLRTQGHALMLIGLAGITAYEIALHVSGHAALRADIPHGLWIGACIGLKLLGLIQLRASRS